MSYEKKSPYQIELESLEIEQRENVDRLLDLKDKKGDINMDFEKELNKEEVLSTVANLFAVISEQSNLGKLHHANPIYSAYHEAMDSLDLPMHVTQACVKTQLRAILGL